MTVGDVHHTLCKQKETLVLYMRRMVREPCQIAGLSLGLPFTVNKVRTFRNYQLYVYFSLPYVKTCGTF